MFLMLKHKVDKQHPQSVWGDFCHFLLIEMMLKEKKAETSATANDLPLLS